MSSPTPAQEPWVTSYRLTAGSASLAVADAPPVAAKVPLVSMVAFRAADLQVREKGPAGRPGAVVAAPAGAGVAAGTLVTFCHPVVSVPAVARRDGTVLAGGWLPDFVRLGELERHIGDGVIEAIAARAVASGRVPAPQRRRLMSLPLVMRLMVAMTLMPDAGSAQVAYQLAGHLADVPSVRDWHVPTSKVFTRWRDMAGPALMEDLFWQVAGPLVADDAPSAVNLAGMPVCGIDGMLVAVADTPANRTSAEAWGRVPSRNTHSPPSGSHSCAAQLTHFPLQFRDPPRILRRGTRPLTAVDLHLPDPGPQRLRVNTQLPGHPGDLAAALTLPVTDLQHHLHRALAQLLGALPLC